MENDYQEVDSYTFLLEENVEKYFANINIMLLSGKHIDQRYFGEFQTLEEHEAQWAAFYLRLYKLELVSEIFDQTRCYYLDFLEQGKGGLSHTTRHRELSELQTLFGLALLDMYYQRFFELEKIIHWNDIKLLLTESDYQDAYKRVFFGDVRESYDEREWSDVQRKFTKAIDTFDNLGWVERQSTGKEELLFEIKPAILRLAKLYKKELENFDSFSHHIRKKGSYD